MTATRFLAVLLVVVILATVAQPARAEAIEATTVVIIVSAVVVVVLLVAIVVIGSMRDRQRGEASLLLADQGGDAPLLFAQVDAAERPAAAQTP
jgi:hypothetical protein